MNEPTNSACLVSKDVRRRFERAAASFDSADFVHTVTRDGLLMRMEPLLVDAATVVDLGSATSAALRSLSKRFRRAHIISVDIAQQMLSRGRKKRAWFSNSTFVQANATALPFADQSVDVIFANLLLPWIDAPQAIFGEVARVLRKGGLFSFATLGPDSLQELRRAWQRVDGDTHVNRFADMHNLGDALVRAGLVDPVLDVDRLRVEYDSSTRLFADLTATGGRNALQQRRRSLTGKERYAAMVSLLEQSAVEGKLALDLEVVFGHCWGAGPKMDATNYRIDAANIPLRRSGTLSYP